MINSLNEGNGGVNRVNIKPSARRSIHDHSGACLMRLHETMGRYGRHSHHRHERAQEPSQQDAPGTDVVDNVMSKMARSSTPLSIQRDGCRRNSVDVINYDQSDDDDFDERNLLSKSSPATFSQLHCSDELIGSSVQHENNITRNRLQTSYNSHSAPRYNSLATDTSHELNTRSEGSIGGKTIMSTSLVVFGIVAIAILCVKSDYLNTQVIPTNNISSKSIFYNDVNNLGLKYKLNSDAVLRIRSGLSTIFKNERTASFIFVYNSKADTFEPTVFNNFIKELAGKTVKFLRSDGNTAYVVVDTRTMQTDLELMDLQHDVDRTGVMLVPDVHEVPSELAMAFHFYCDEYNPLVKRSAIFFTLDMATCLSNKQLTHEYIEKCLSKKWHNIHEDKIGPLLTRVVNIVIDTTNI